MCKECDILTNTFWFYDFRLIIKSSNNFYYKALICKELILQYDTIKMIYLYINFFFLKIAFISLSFDVAWKKINFYFYMLLFMSYLFTFKMSCLGKYHKCSTSIT